MDRKELINRIYETALEYNSLVRFLPTSEIAFKHKFLDGSSLCCCMFDYYRNDKKKEMDLTGRIVRNITFEFKKGYIFDICADLLTAAILNEPLLCYDSNTVLLAIPASSKAKHEKRFKAFGRHLSENLGIVDGFPFIELTRDREPNAIREGMSFFDVLNLVDEDSIAGKDIFLIDDLYASGSSFKKMSDFLISANVRSVTGLFLTKSMEK